MSSSSSLIPAEAIVGTTVAMSFILLGNAITQSFMGVPALLIDFPHPSSPSHPQAAKHLGQQWPVFWRVGNVFFRPISTFGIIGYGYAAWASYSRSFFSSSSSYSTTITSGSNSNNAWKFYAISALCHLITVVHSAVNMQPINAKIEGLNRREGDKNKTDPALAEYYARKWARLNLVRLVMPAVAGSVALWTTLRAGAVGRV
ncbi:hypothetical protein GE21DRAFT_8603 [Neurospora crassa]|uniref:DUF1772-domain-containing protein n=1 Tax=Neurospora crassa (strain ATCC 24698 / 74-OR23-1A / CBS 708.71 / DSM 1257 / FGSC 987) TaxID=367110 RepID=Q7S684_NEUCR|nr:hypothetical protein NCU07091 [Neurospora crassa OR74A]EAA31016.1 hypothetical protein NCU07091 [Neurospora crassa OR74A]KHE86835.1 hypothetical protein GE21DRAFT_8603 [Neurospora crassa]|eukprot:XP_960252.1 hypothetical protein NCU07091 [Neurospora crassa OR74A]